MATPESTIQAWDRYWSDGRGAACQADEHGLYTGPLAERWRGFFAGLPTGCRMLDLATGNGALADLAGSTLAPNQLPASFHGVDIADIRPRLSRPPIKCLKVRFHPRTRNEALPFAAAMFDAVISQYGFEYGELDATVGEIARVLRPGGSVRLICHWRAGDIARDAHDEAARAAQLGALDLPARIARLVRIQQRDGRYINDSHRRTWQTPEARSLKQGLAEGFRIARCAPNQPRGNLGLYLHNLAHLYQHREQHPVELMLEKMDECRTELDVHRQRLEALVNASLDDERLERVLRALTAAGLVPDTPELVQAPASGRVVAIDIRVPGRQRSPHEGDTVSVTEASHWSEYWQGDVRTSFGDGAFDRGYDDAVAEFWNRVGATLPERAVAVDLGTGNGAVIALLARQARELGRHWRLIGVDAADIAIDKELQALSDPAMIDLIGRTSMEATGLPAATADLVCGNYALEYGDPDATVAELVRLLAPKGRIAALIHHPESLVTRRAREQERAISRLLDEHRIPARFAEWVRQAARGDRAGEAESNRAVQIIRQGLDGRDAGSSYALKVLEHFAGALTPGPETADDRLRFIDQFTDSLAAWRKRMRDMQRASLDEKQFQAWCDRITAHGVNRIETGELTASNGDLLARSLLARR